MASASAFVSALPVPGATQTRTWNRKQDIPLNSARLGIASPSVTLLRASSAPLRRAINQPQQSFNVDCKTIESAGVLDREDQGVEKEETSILTPSTLQVQSLLEEICDDTKIAELKLKVGDFSLHLKRDVGKAKAAAVPLAPLSTQSAASPPPATVVIVPSSTAPVLSNNLASSLLPATVSKTASLFGLLEAAADQGLSFVTSPKVGVFRRGRNVRGKVGKPIVNEGATIKEGQVVGYLEQLGTQQPVEAQVSGEVVQVLWEDGESVGYGDPLISIRPSFPGIVSRAALN